MARPSSLRMSLQFWQLRQQSLYTQGLEIKKQAIETRKDLLAAAEAARECGLRKNEIQGLLERMGG